MTSRHLGTLPGWRSGLAAVLALAAAGPFAGVATADPQTPLVVATVYHSGGSPTTDTVSLSQLQAGAGRCPQYQRGTMEEVGDRGPVGVSLPPATVDTGTWALSDVLACMQTPIPSRAVTGVTIARSDGSPDLRPGAQIAPADLASPSDFQNTAENPVISDEGTEVEYDRPWRGGSDQDYEDQVNESPPVSIEVFEGPALTVKATASQTTVAPRTTVSFSATVAGPDDGGLSYSWNYDGAAASSTLPNPNIAFQTPGVFDVTLLVTDAAGGGGGTEIPITVTGSAPANGSGSPTGPNKSSGKTRGGAPGKAQPRSSTADKGAKGNSGTGSGSGSATNNQGGTTTTGSAPSGSSGASTTNPASSSTAGSAHGAASAHVASPPLPHGQTHRTRPPPPSSASRAPLVDGRLVSDVIPVASGSSPLVHSEPAAVA
ncbi:MAG: PKD domain-containing protein, partial [Solirubrobacteraceae bacterium]